MEHYIYTELKRGHIIMKLEINITPRAQNAGTLSIGMSYYDVLTKVLYLHIIWRMLWVNALQQISLQANLEVYSYNTMLSITTTRVYRRT